MAATLRERHEIPEQYKWNKESVFASNDAWETALSETLARLDGLRAYRGRLKDGGETLANALALRDELDAATRRVFIYASFSAAVDSHDETARAQVGRVQALHAQLGATAALIEPELLAVGEDTLLRWAAKESSLAIYDHYFRDLLRKQEHIRSAEVE